MQASGLQPVPTMESASQPLQAREAAKEKKEEEEDKKAAEKAEKARKAQEAAKEKKEEEEDAAAKAAEDAKKAEEAAAAAKVAAERKKTEEAAAAAKAAEDAKKAEEAAAAAKAAAERKKAEEAKAAAKAAEERTKAEEAAAAAKAAEEQCRNDYPTLDCDCVRIRTLPRPECCDQGWSGCPWHPDCIPTASGDLTIKFLEQKLRKIIHKDMQSIQECFPRDSVPSNERVMTILGGFDDWAGHIELGRKTWSCSKMQGGAKEYHEEWQSMVCPNCQNRYKHAHHANAVTVFGAWGKRASDPYSEQVQCFGSDPCSIHPPPADFFKAPIDCGNGGKSGDSDSGSDSDSDSGKSGDSDSGSYSDSDSGKGGKRQWWQWQR
jgi:hypothetical protein